MSYVPLGALVGLGSSPESLAAKGMDLEKQAIAYRKAGQADLARTFQNMADLHYAQARALRTQGATKARAADSAPAPAPAAVSDGPGRIQVPTKDDPVTRVVLPTYRVPRREPRRSLLPPMALPGGVQFGPAEQPSALEAIPTWAWVVGGVSLAVIVSSALLRVRS